MEDLKFYYLIEFTPDIGTEILGINLSKEFPGLNKVVSGSDDFNTYDLCTKACLELLQTKLESLNKSEDGKYKIFFEKNQFTSLDDSWEQNEVVKIYISDSLSTVYNSLFNARVFFRKESLFVFDAPKTLQ